MSSKSRDFLFVVIRLLASVSSSQHAEIESVANKTLQWLSSPFFQYDSQYSQRFGRGDDGRDSWRDTLADPLFQLFGILPRRLLALSHQQVSCRSSLLRLLLKIVEISRCSTDRPLRALSNSYRVTAYPSPKLGKVTLDKFWTKGDIDWDYYIARNEFIQHYSSWLKDQSWFLRKLMFPNFWNFMENSSERSLKVFQRNFRRVFDSFMHGVNIDEYLETTLWFPFQAEASPLMKTRRVGRGDHRKRIPSIKKMLIVFDSVLRGQRTSKHINGFLYFVLSKKEFESENPLVLSILGRFRSLRSPPEEITSKMDSSLPLLISSWWKCSNPDSENGLSSNFYRFLEKFASCDNHLKDKLLLQILSHENSNLLPLGGLKYIATFKSCDTIQSLSMLLQEARFLAFDEEKVLETIKESRETIFEIQDSKFILFEIKTLIDLLRSWSLSPAVHLALWECFQVILQHILVEKDPKSVDSDWKVKTTHLILESMGTEIILDHLTEQIRLSSFESLSEFFSSKYIRGDSRVKCLMLSLYLKLLKFDPVEELRLPSRMIEFCKECFERKRSDCYNSVTRLWIELCKYPEVVSTRSSQDMFLYLISLASEQENVRKIPILAEYSNAYQLNKVEEAINSSGFIEDDLDYQHEF